LEIGESAPREARCQGTLDTLPPVSNPPVNHESSLDFRPILLEMTESALRIRSTLRNAIKAVLPPDSDFTSRQIADVLGLDKTSGWRCVRMATIADVAGILGSLPRGKGWGKILAGLAGAGCPEAQLSELRSAVDDLQNRIVRRGISPATLEVIAAGERDDESRKTLVRRIRQQHFESTMLTVGVSARARIGAMIVAPNEDGRSADLVGVTLIEGLERHRAGPPWNIHVGLQSMDGGGPPESVKESSPWLARWSRPDRLGEEVIAEIDNGRWRIDFVDRSPTSSETVRVACCETMHRAGPLHATDPDEVVTMLMPHGLAVQVAVFDILLHRSIRPSAVPYAALYATLDRITRGEDRTDCPETTRLPLESTTEAVDGPDLAGSVTDLSPVWCELLAHGAGTLGFEVSEFVVHRTIVDHPPVPCSVTVRWGLPTLAGG